VLKTEERRRETWCWPGIENLWADIRFASRQLWKSPGFAITAMLALALGIGGAIAIFGFVDSALIRPLPYSNPSRLVGVFKTSPLGGEELGYSYPDYLDMVRSNSVFTSVAAYDGDGGFVLTDPAGAHLVDGAGATSDFFRILGVTPVLGRDFAATPANEDLLAEPSTVILSYAAWQRWFGGRPEVLGKTVTLDGQAYTVIGVLPRRFEFAPAGAVDFWTTLRRDAGDLCYASRGCMSMHVVARLKNGVTMQQALADLQGIAAQEARLHPDPDKDRGGNIAPLSRWILGDVQPILLVLLGGAGLLLLIAYVNVTGLLLVRSENRRREFAVRGVLGASRGRLMQQFVIEAFIVAAAGSALGMFAATLARRLLLDLIPTGMIDSMPYLRGSGWNWHVAPFAAALVVIACALFAITPALRLPFANLRAGLAQGDRGTPGTAWRRLGAKLVVLELATTMVLLAGAGLLGKSLYELMNVHLGFDPSHLATLRVSAPESRHSTREQASALASEIMSRLQNLPGVLAVGTARALPVTGVAGTQIGFVGRPGLGESNEVGHQVISAEYLPLLKARVLRGRNFNENDSANALSVAIINQTLARRYFPAENPIGKQIFYHQHGSAPGLDGPRHPIRIVGVIANVKDYGLSEAAKPVVYTPAVPGPGFHFSLVVRTSQDAASVLPSLAATIHEIDPQILTSGAATMPEIIQGSPAAYWHRVSAWLAGGFAALALVLSTIGLYGVIAYSVSRRTREIGVRMALGATHGSVYELILKEAGWLTLFGIAIGLCGSIAAGMFMRSLLFGVQSWDFSILGGVAGVLVAFALLASYVPARRAASVDPVEALRAE
jgi:macrolide transport system ATP-binding/permease protein